MAIPNLLLVGVAKAGTTSAHAYLDSHPQVFMSRVKEPHYFSDVGPNCPTVVPVKDWNRYVDLFVGSGNASVIGESSVSYLHCAKAVGRIRKSLGRPKILIILRDPVTRCFSHWLMDYREGYQHKPFLEAVKEDYYLAKEKGFCTSHMYVESSLYFDAILRYLDAFGDNVKIMWYEDLVERPWEFMREVFEFLGVDQDFQVDFGRRDNVAAAPRNELVKFLFHNMALRKLAKRVIPSVIRSGLRNRLMTSADKTSIKAEEKEYLVDFFVEDRARLQSLLEKDLSRWLK